MCVYDTIQWGLLLWLANEEVRKASTKFCFRETGVSSNNSTRLMIRRVKLFDAVGELKLAESFTFPTSWWCVDCASVIVVEVILA